MFSFNTRLYLGNTFERFRFFFFNEKIISLLNIFNFSKTSDKFRNLYSLQHGNFKNNLKCQYIFEFKKNCPAIIIKVEFVTVLKEIIDLDNRFCKRADDIAVKSWIYDSIRFVLSASRFRLLREKVGQEKSDSLRGGLVGGVSGFTSQRTDSTNGSKEFASCRV